MIPLELEVQPKRWRTVEWLACMSLTVTCACGANGDRAATVHDAGVDATADGTGYAPSGATDAGAVADAVVDAAMGGDSATGGDASGTPPIPVWTNRYDNQRTGSTPLETQLAQANVRPGRFGLLFSRPVDGTIQAQPLYVPGLTINGATHNVVFAATFNDSVYAFDADDPAASAPLWVRSMGPAVPYGSATAFSCGDILPTIGITSTPVIDVPHGTLYTTAKTFENGAYVHRLHALDILTGNERPGSPVTILPSARGTASDAVNGVITFDPTTQLQRPGILLEQGVIYLAFGSHCDSDPYHGWVLAYDAATLGLRGTYINTPDGNEGGIWQSGMGLSSDGHGVYFVAGNGDIDHSGAGAQLGLSVGRLVLGSYGLLVQDFWTPANADQMNSTDLDLTTGAVVGPGNLLFVGGKVPNLWVLDRNHMGGFNSAGDQIVQTLPHPGGEMHGGPVYWAGPSGPELFIWPEGAGLEALRVNPQSTTAPIDPTPIAVNTTTLPSHPGGIVTVSSNGSAAGSGIVWASLPLSGGGDGWHSIVQGTLYAFSADNLADLLWSSDMDPQDRLGYFAKFCPPTVVNGRLYIGTAVDSSTSQAALRVYGPIERPIPAPTAGATYALVNRATSWAMDVNQASTTAGTAVIQWPGNGGANQHWTLETASSGALALVNVNSNMVLELPAGADAGNGLEQDVATGAANQQWTMTPAETPGYYVLASAKGGLVVTSPSTNQGDALTLAAPNGATSQEWALIPIW
jgi:hypothetical protein